VCSILFFCREKNGEREREGGRDREMQEEEREVFSSNPVKGPFFIIIEGEIDCVVLRVTKKSSFFFFTLSFFLTK